MSLDLLMPASLWREEKGEGEERKEEGRWEKGRVEEKGEEERKTLANISNCSPK